MVRKEKLNKIYTSKKMTGFVERKDNKVYWMNKNATVSMRVIYHPNHTPTIQKINWFAKHDNKKLDVNNFEKFFSTPEITYWLVDNTRRPNIELSDIYFFYDLIMDSIRKTLDTFVYIDLETYLFLFNHIISGIGKGRNCTVMFNDYYAIFTIHLFSEIDEIDILFTLTDYEKEIFGTEAKIPEL